MVFMCACFCVCLFCLLGAQSFEGRCKWCLLTYLCRSIVLKRTKQKYNVLIFNELRILDTGEGVCSGFIWYGAYTNFRKEKNRRKKLKIGKKKFFESKISRVRVCTCVCIYAYVCVISIYFNIVILLNKQIY